MNTAHEQEHLNLTSKFKVVFHGHTDWPKIKNVFWLILNVFLLLDIAFLVIFDVIMLKMSLVPTSNFE